MALADPSSAAPLPLPPLAGAPTAPAELSEPAPWASHRWPGLVLVLLLALFTRVWGVVYTDVIQRDGVTFINMARELASGGVGSVIERFDQHIGYPSLIALLHGTLGLPDTIESWERCGQWISVVMGTGATLGVWALTGLALNWRLAWISASLFAVGRKWSMLGADVMSDATSLCLFIWGVVLVIRSAQAVHSNRAAAWAAGAGLLAGLAYLVRPEGVGAALVGCVVWVTWALLRRIPARRALVACLLCAGMAGSLVLPYAIATGSFTKKKQLAPVTAVAPNSGLALLAVSLPLATPAATTPATAPSNPAAAQPPPPPAGPPPRGPAAHFATGQAIIVQTVEALNPVVFGLSCIWLLATCLHYSLPPRLRQPHLKVPHGPAALAMGATLLLFIPILARLHIKAGYLDWRHCMSVAFVLAPLGGAGLVAVFDFCTANLGQRLKVSHPDRFARNAWFLLFPIIIACTGFSALRPLHGGNDYVRDAGKALAKHARPGERAITNLNWVLHYAQVPGELIPSWNVANETYLAKLAAADPRPDLLVVSDRYLNDFEPPLHNRLKPPRFEKLGTFRQRSESRGDVGGDIVTLYRIHWDAP